MGLKWHCLSTQVIGMQWSGAVSRRNDETALCIPSVGVPVAMVSQFNSVYEILGFQNPKCLLKGFILRVIPFFDQRC